MACCRIGCDSSLRARKSVRTFSAWARCLSNLASSDWSVANRIVASGSAMATVNSFSNTSLTTAMACDETWLTIGSRANIRAHASAACSRTSAASCSR